MLKVADICSTDTTDPTHCATSVNIEIDHIKGELLFYSEDSCRGGGSKSSILSQTEVWLLHLRSKKHECRTSHPSLLLAIVRVVVIIGRCISFNPKP